MLTDLARRQGTTLLLVTHSMPVARTADRVLRLSHGHLTPEPVR
jgi:ABC-type lipoprotein export system ATPase subunit